MVPSLSRLRQLPILAGLVEPRGEWQFILQTLLGFVTFVALFTAFGKAVGFHWLIVMVPVCAVFGALAAISPRPVVNGMELCSLLLILGTLVTCSLAVAREDARRRLCLDNLRNVGLGFQGTQQFDRSSKRTVQHRIGPPPSGLVPAER
jgi:hypothetical protein